MKKELLDDRVYEYVSESVHSLAPEEIFGDEFTDTFQSMEEVELLMFRLLEDFVLFLVNYNTH